MFRRQGLTFGDLGAEQFENRRVRGPHLTVSRHEELWRLQQQTHSPTNPGSHSQRVMPAPTIGFSSAPEWASSRTEGGAGRQRSHGLSDRMIAWLFIAPTILLLLVINIFPLIWSIQLSFTNFKANRAVQGIQNVGILNYINILHDLERPADHRAFFSGRSCCQVLGFRWRGFWSASSAGTPSGRR